MFVDRRTRAGITTRSEQTLFEVQKMELALKQDV